MFTGKVWQVLMQLANMIKSLGKAWLLNPFVLNDAMLVLHAAFFTKK